MPKNETYPSQGLIVNETVTTMKIYKELQDWEAVKKRVAEENLLQKTRSSSALRFVREVKSRSEVAYDWEAEALIEAERFEDQVLFCYVIALRKYGIFRDFFFEVIQPKVAVRDYLIEPYEVKSFLYKKREANPVLDAKSDTTFDRIRKMTALIFTEAGILTKGTTKKILPFTVPGYFLEYYTQRGLWNDAAVLLPDPRELKRLKGEL